MWRDVNPEQNQGFGPSRAAQDPLPALHQPPGSAAELRPALPGTRSATLGGELCMSTECHLVGFHFISHISLKLYFLIKNVPLCIALMHRFDAYSRGEN